MRAIIKARELNKSGIFVSEIDTDNSYISKSNPKGHFAIIVEPAEDCGEDNCIKYQRINGQLYVEGESYIIEGKQAIIKRKIEEWIARYEMYELPKKEITFVKTDLEINFDLAFNSRPTDCR